MAFYSSFWVKCFKWYYKYRWRFNNILSIDDKIRVIDDKKTEAYKIIEITTNYIKIDKSIESDKCFIYCKEVNNIHTLSKEYIFTLNACATQELYKLIQQQQTIINDLQNRLSILENKISNYYYYTVIYFIICINTL